MEEFANSENRMEYYRADILGTHINYAEEGAGDPIVFIHGNPTSSYLWRNVVPHISDLGRCLVPDLMGMGMSGSSPTGRYRFIDHVRVLDAWFEAVGATRDVVLVLHDWGAALGFYRAFRFSRQIKAVVYMEALIQPRSWEELPPDRQEIFSSLRSKDGEAMVLKENFLIEQVLPQSVIRSLTDDEMDAYRKPFETPESRVPTLAWVRELPIGGEPKDVEQIVLSYSRWLACSNLPKLLLPATKGTILRGRLLELCRKWPNQKETSPIEGGHYLQEDSPNKIGYEIANFIEALG